MKKKDALILFESRISDGDTNEENLICKSGIEIEIRKLLECDSLFKEIVAELGCAVLAKYYFNSRVKAAEQKEENIKNS